MRKGGRPKCPNFEFAGVIMHAHKPSLRVTRRDNPDTFNHQNHSPRISGYRLFRGADAGYSAGSHRGKLRQTYL